MNRKSLRTVLVIALTLAGLWLATAALMVLRVELDCMWSPGFAWAIGGAMWAFILLTLAAGLFLVFRWRLPGCGCFALLLLAGGVGLFALNVLALFTTFAPDHFGEGRPLPEERPLHLPFSSGNSYVRAPMIWLMKQPDAHARLAALAARNPAMWECPPASSPTVHWKHEGKTYRFVLPKEDFSGFDTPPPQPFLEALHPMLGEFRLDAPIDAVYVSMSTQPGLYRLHSTLGRPLLLPAKTTPGGPLLSGHDRRPLPAEGGDFVIHEGDWGDYYGVTLELHDADTGALLLRRTYLLDGWQH